MNLEPIVKELQRQVVKLENWIRRLEDRLERVWALFTATGDIIIGTGGGTAGTLSVGENDTFLIADSAETLGVKWGVGSYQAQRYDVPSSYTLTIPSGYQYLIYGSFTVTGDLVLVGDLVVL